MVLNDPKALALVVRTLPFVPNAMVILSVAAYPVPVTITFVPTLPAVGLTLTTCGWMLNIFIAELIPLAVMVVVPQRCTSTVHVVVNDPYGLAIVC